MSEAVIRKHFFFSGQVQGVGFRYRAYYAAQRAGVTGWVMNLDDGRVEMEAQGTYSAISQMLGDLYRSQFIRITDLQARNIPADPGERTFQIAN